MADPRALQGARDAQGVGGALRSSSASYSCRQYINTLQNNNVLYSVGAVSVGLSQSVNVALTYSGTKI